MYLILKEKFSIYFYFRYLKKNYDDENSEQLYINKLKNLEFKNI